MKNFSKIEFQKALNAIENQISGFCAQYPNSFPEVLHKNAGFIVILVSVCMLGAVSDSMVYFVSICTAPVLFVFGVILQAKTKKRPSVFKYNEVSANIQHLNDELSDYPDVVAYCKKSQDYIASVDSQRKRWKNTFCISYFVILVAFILYGVITFLLITNYAILYNVGLDHDEDISISASNPDDKPVDFQVNCPTFNHYVFSAADIPVKGSDVSDCILVFVDSTDNIVPFSPKFYLKKDGRTYEQDGYMHFVDCKTDEMNPNERADYGCARFLDEVAKGKVRYKVLKYD